jgi:hypothetical protein
MFRANLNSRDQIFDYIKTGDVKLHELISCLNSVHNLLNQSSDREKTTVLNAILLRIQDPKSSISVVNNLIAFLSEVITSHKEKLDLAAKDEAGNTPLHNVFHYALHAKDEQLSKQFTKIGCRFINLIKNSREFKKIMTLKNKSGVSCLRIFYLTYEEKEGLTDAEFKNLVYIGQKVTPLISPPSPDKIEFTEKSFKNQLQELLTDSVTCDLMEEPFLFPREGHTYGRKTWDRNNYVNPQTRTVFKKEELETNGSVLILIGLFKKYFDVNEPEQEDAEKEKALANEIQQYFSDIQIAGIHPAEAAVIAHFEQDVTTKDIKNLLNAYQKHLASQNANTGEPQPSSAFRTEQEPEKPIHVPEDVHGDQPEPLPPGDSGEENYLEAPPPEVIPQPEPDLLLDSIDGNQLAGPRPNLGEEDPAHVDYGDREADSFSSELVEINIATKNIRVILKSICENIENKNQGRATWFTCNTEAKVNKLNSIYNWLENRILDPEDETIVLALIRDVCAIKRNKLGFFTPHSAIEFKDWLESLSLTCCATVHFNDKDLQQINIPGNIDLLITDARKNTIHMEIPHFTIKRTW